MNNEMQSGLLHIVSSSREAKSERIHLSSCAREWTVFLQKNSPIDGWLVMVKFA